MSVESAVITLIAGMLVLLLPKLLRYTVGAYLLITGFIALVYAL